jgi:hypothetical protein
MTDDMERHKKTQKHKSKVAKGVPMRTIVGGEPQNHRINAPRVLPRRRDRNYNDP